MSTKALLHTLGTPFRVFKAVCFWLGFSLIVVLTLVFAALFFFFNSLPNFDELEFNSLKKEAQSVVKSHYSRPHKHEWVDIDSISRDFLYVLVMAEDAQFFTHKGFNYDAMIDALFQNVKADEIKFGASTISQQVSKNLFLNSEKNIVRKIKEYFITQDLEKKFTKNQILELYVNMAEFGPDIYGATQAAEHYFHLKPNEINAAQAAFIALMLPSPRKYHYMLFENHNFTKALREKYKRILKDMRFKEYISAKQYNSYIRYEFFTKESL